MPNVTWSHSSLKDYEGCARRYHEVKVLKNFPFVENEATRYGTEFHKAAEDYIKDGTPIPPQFMFAKDMLDALIAKPGRKVCEQQMALTADLKPCDWKSKDVWVRGIADLLIINGEEARCIDYKTGKSAKYADTSQLELMALAVFKHFPQVKKVKGGLLFVISKNFIKDSYSADNQDKMWTKWLTEYSRMKYSYKNDVWNPRPSGLCRKHCAVLECAHNGRN